MTLPDDPHAPIAEGSAADLIAWTGACTGSAVA
jgi:hypothetical protein